MSAAPADVMCTLCGLAGTVETEVASPDGVRDALIWAAHFAAEHPSVSSGVSRFLVMTEADR